VPAQYDYETDLQSGAGTACISNLGHQLRRSDKEGPAPGALEETSRVSVEFGYPSMEDADESRNVFGRPGAHQRDRGRAHTRKLTER